MKTFTRITFDPQVMGGRACIRGLRFAAGMLVGLMAAGRSRAEILQAYPYVEDADITEALALAEWQDEPVNR